MQPWLPCIVTQAIQPHRRNAVAGCPRALSALWNQANSRAAFIALNPAPAVQLNCTIRVLEESAVYRTEAMSNPEAVRLYLKLKLASLEHEEFHVIWLDAQNRLIAFDALFSGTLTQTSVYPREVVKAALAHNAAGCILAHNHPSGMAEPSRAEDIASRQAAEAAMTKFLDLMHQHGCRWAPLSGAAPDGTRFQVFSHSQDGERKPGVEFWISARPTRNKS